MNVKWYFKVSDTAFLCWLLLSETSACVEVHTHLPITYNVSLILYLNIIIFECFASYNFLLQTLLNHFFILIYYKTLVTWLKKHCTFSNVIKYGVRVFNC